MYKILIILFTAFLISSCSKKDESNPVNNNLNATGFILSQVDGNNWSADKLEVSKDQGSLIINGINELSGGSISSATLNFRIINISQPGNYGVGENEPGFTYFVKSTYTLKHNDGTPDKVFTAYYENFSLMKINSINNNSIDADFSVFYYNSSRTDSVTITGGRLKLEY